MQRAMRVIGYVRCSTLEQAADGLSIEAQRAKISAWCDVAGAELVEVIEDAGVSGGRALVDRPGGSRVAELLVARNGGVDAVVIVRLDRLGRNAAETLAYLRRFASVSMALVSIVDRVDLSTPQSRAMAQLGAVFAELEKAVIGQRTSEALSVLRSEGRVYGPRPYGFKVLGGRLVPLATEQRILARMRRATTCGT